MNFREILAQLLERGNAMLAFWVYYLTISFGMIAFFGNAKWPRNSVRAKLMASVFSLGFILFAAVNCGGMMDIASQRKLLHGLLVPAAEGLAAAAGRDSTALDGGRLPVTGLAEALEKVTSPTGPGGVRAFHVAADAIVLAVIWVLALRLHEPASAGEAVREFREAARAGRA